MPQARLDDLQLHRSIDAPALQSQLYQALSERIFQGRLVPGDRLPASRRLARDLNIGRNTVLAVYDQLAAEGFIEQQPRRGVFVHPQLPLLKRPETPRVTPAVSPPKPPAVTPPWLKGPDGPMTPPDWNERNAPFTPGLPDLNAFPLRTWNRLLHHQESRRSLMGYDGHQGFPPLRRAIADYLRSARGVRCEPEQVIVTQGAQQALSLIAALFLDRGDRVLMEDPGYRGSRYALHTAGVMLEPIPLKDEVLDLERLPDTTEAKLLYCTPTHQYPMGGILTASQRLRLLNWAVERDVWIIEDDYDSEFHFYQKPFAALQGLIDPAPVLYLGSFSKTLFPGLRLGYLVVPPHLVGAFTQLKRIQTGETSPLLQAVTAEFIEEGHFHRHLRRMRQLYQHKWEHLQWLCEQYLEGLYTPIAQSAGMHLVLERDVDDRAVAARMAEVGYRPLALSEYGLGESPRRGLVVGFASADESELQTGIQRLAQLG
ncbi:MocR-like pyridoxine biosynthesis transcription factor PdxR [Saccharospirillum salsuginis]|uniref:Transcriptional regulator n=1 Tax=Saccharospirillum salsuginis TaxID=418750 RepID=A0A918KC97_9GAMM|nr:PLP-dependent aminotransferase family protein [Saccharospirillum salsuginis]GGX58639.1 transcriptional regulator [Saccharospirillum salsuginis]